MFIEQIFRLKYVYQMFVLWFLFTKSNGRSWEFDFFSISIQIYLSIQSERDGLS